MHISCERNVLLDSINLVQRAVSTRTTMPILECILLDCNESGFRMFSTDQEIAIKTAVIKCRVFENGAIALPSRFFAEIMRKLPEGEVSIKAEENLVVFIKSGSSEFKIIGMRAEEFPEIEEIDRQIKYEVSQGVFKNLIKRTVFSVCQDSSKPNLMGALIEIGSGVINMVTCDAFRVSFARGEAEAHGSVKECSAIVPAKAISEMQRLIVHEEQDMSMFITDKHVLFDIGTCTIFSRLIEGEFINYEGIFPDDFRTRLTLERSLFSDSLDRAALVSYYENKKNPVRLKMKDNILSVTTSSEAGNSFDELQVDLFGEELEIAFNPKFLIDAVKSIDEDEITVELNTPLSPCVIKPVAENDEYKYLVLPLRLKS